MLCLSGFELFSRWVLLLDIHFGKYTVGAGTKCTSQKCLGIKSVFTHVAIIYANLWEQKKSFA